MSQSLFTSFRIDHSFEKLSKPIYLCPFGDVHRFTPLCDDKAWLDMLTWCEKKQKENDVLYWGKGDYDDIFSDSERAALKHSGMHDQTLESFEDMALRRSRNFVKEIKFMGGRLLGLEEGNHYGELRTGMTTTQFMCNELNTRYFGGMTLVRLVFKHKGYCRSTHLDILSMHGTGASRRPGGSINKVDDMRRVAPAEIYMQAHDHRKLIVPVTELRVKYRRRADGIDIYDQRILLVRTGSFLRGYVNNEESYCIKRAYDPCDIGIVKIELTPRIKYLPRISKGTRLRDYLYMDLHGSI